METKLDKVKQYIPDSTEAEQWLSEDVFVYRGQHFKILPSGRIVRISRNGNKGA